MSTPRIVTSRSFTVYNCSCSQNTTSIIPYVLSLLAGKYKVELWGASGGGPSHISGLGGFAVAILNLNSETSFYLYVGGSGSYSLTHKPHGGSNGGD